MDLYSIPMIFPLIGEVRWGMDYGNNRGPHMHTGLDMKAPKLTPIVAPIDGIIGFKKYSFWIWNAKGYAILGTHLNDDTPGTNDNTANFDYMFAPNLKPGTYVSMGQFIGYVGNSTDATAPHLHFELYAAGKGPTMKRIRNPLPSLKTGQVLDNPKPYAGMSTEKPQADQVRWDGCFRKYDPESRLLTLIMVARITANSTQMITRPTYMSCKLSAEDGKLMRLAMKKGLKGNSVINAFVEPPLPDSHPACVKLVLPRLVRS